VDANQKGRLTVELHTDSLEQFAAVKTALATVPTLSSVSILAMDVGLARLSLSYLGGVEQLRESLARAGLKLEKAEGGWRLSSSSVSSQAEGQ
jgi:hypothetical protein